MGYHLATATLGPILLLQGRHVRRVTPRLSEAAGPREGTAGDGPPLRLLIVGELATHRPHRMDHPRSLGAARGRDRRPFRRRGDIARRQRNHRRRAAGALTARSGGPGLAAFAALRHHHRRAAVRGAADGAVSGTAAAAARLSRNAGAAARQRARALGGIARGLRAPAVCVSAQDRHDGFGRLPSGRSRLRAVGGAGRCGDPATVDDQARPGGCAAPRTGSNRAR